MYTNSIILIQGSFPGGMPHKSVIKLSAPNDYILQRKPFLNQNNLSIQKTSSGNAFQIDQHRLNLNGSGSQLPNNVRQKMESVFDADFSNVKIHTGGNQAESIGALAFTTGNDIYFAQGQYSPHSSYGQRILGHELTHVVQQRNGRVRNPFGNGITVVNDQNLEAEAERMGLYTLSFNLQESRRISSLPNSIQAQIKKEIQRTTSNKNSVSANTSEQTSVPNSNDNRLHYHLPTNTIQMTVDTDIQNALKAIDNHEKYTSFTLPELKEVYPYITKSTEKIDPGIAGFMSNGFKAWAENYENKTKAYLLEARKALDFTKSKKGTLAVLGVDIKKDPDITVIKLIDEDLLTAKSVELKSCDSGFKAVQELLYNGIHQLKKREVVGNTYGITYDKHLLVINLHAPTNYPFNDDESKNLALYFRGANPYDLSNYIVQVGWNTKLAERIGPFVGKQGFNKPVEVRMQYQGKNYASYSTY